MTLAAAWIRQIGQTEELVVASDSRLRFGRAWDCCPKVFRLPRSDAALCFAHNTAFAYPIIQQVRTAIEVYQRARSRAMDLGSMRGHILRVMNGMLPYLHDAPKGMSASDDLDTVFILAGFSWMKGEFRIWIYRFDRATKQFTFGKASRWLGRRFAFAGDETDVARQRLKSLMTAKGKATVGGLDMEPFEVIRDMSRDAKYLSIGGPPQVVKIYRHMNVMPYAVAWPSRGKGLSLLGRPLLDYEATSFLVLDPDTLATSTYAEYSTSIGAPAP